MYPPRTSQETDSEAQRTQSQRTVSNFRRRHPRSDRQHPDGDDNRPKYAPKHGDTSATYWKLYGFEANTYDKNFVESLMGNTNSMVFLNTLFSAIVAAFIIEIYKTLSPTNSQPTVTIPLSSAIRINIVLFLSFFLSMVSAVACALIQQWCYEYLKFAYPRAALHESGRVRTYLFQGLNVFPMRRFMYGTHALLHISVIMFFWAIGEFFYNVNHIFGLVIRYALAMSAVIYALLSISPLFFSNSPYNTPMTPLLRAASIILRIIFRLPWWFPQWLRGEPFDLTGLQYYKGIHFDTAHLLSIEAEKRAEKLEPHAMEWLFTENDFSDSDMDKFLESLPGYISSHHTKRDLLYEYLTADHVLTRIKGHFITCATSVELSEEASIARVSCCVQALRLIFENSRERNRSSPVQDEDLQFQQEYIQNIIVDFQTLCDAEDPTMALRASCIRGLAVHGLLSQLVPSVSEDSSHFPVSLIPLHNLFFLNNNADTVRGPDESKRMRKSLLRDGPLANLTMLAKAVRKREHAPFSSLSFCWKTFNILLTQFVTIHSDASSDQPPPSPAQSDFDNLYKGIHQYVHNEEMGFRMTPLLEILDIVDRGRRLLMVFSGRPKYHSRATVVFGKEYLRNGDLLEAFAHCLPDFIANNSPNVCMDFMEKVVCRDGLWSNLQMILSITQRSTSSTSDKFRVFECCCHVLDVAFSILEDSPKVDWRAPEFGSLWQHFESFITHGFQGAFIGRATSFRIGIIKARFCKVLLAQFWDDIICKNVLSFRSQWDVASLAKLIYYLGLRHEDRDDAEFWNSYFNGGHIGAEFTAKAVKMVDIIASDGPLSIFCQLGHLATSTIPSHHSGLERKDIEKVLELQDKLMVDQRLPLNGASDTVQKDLDQLRKQVKDLCGTTSGGIGDTRNADNAGEEGESLQLLLRRIDHVSSLRVTRSEGLGHSGHAEERPSAVSQRSEVNGGSSSSTPITETSEGENGFEQSDSHTLSSSKSTLQSTLHVGTIDTKPIFRSKGPIGSGSPVSRQNPQSVTSGPRRNALIALANPIISLLPHASVTKAN
ncbi:hypothetical protein F5888DRAFT_1139365 [Russula emetica]|nr:hypothetical protein F5888DRAFT_1139365 [Russula emetica]